MSSLTASVMPVELIRPLPGVLKMVAPKTGAAKAATPTAASIAADASKRAAISKTAKDFEASFISSMLGNMFDGVETSAPFGGGEGEKAFKSFLMDAIGKKVVQAGGIGVAASVQHEMLKLQGLS